jgi:hypothetical protein
LYCKHLHAPTDDLSNLEILLASSKGVTSINSKVLTVEVLVRDGKQHRIRHVAVVAWSLRRDLALELLLGDLRFLVLVRLLGGHLRREDTGCKRVDADLEAVFLDLVCEHAVEVDSGSLAGVVVGMVLGCLSLS